MNVICPECKTENRLPDSLDRRITYKCSACQTRFDRISRINFRKVAIVILIIWWLVPGLIWASVPVTQSASENTLQAGIGTLMFWWTPILLPLLVIATAFLLRKGFRHRKFTGTSPKGFRAFVYASVAGFCGFAVGISLFVRYVVAATN